MRREEFDATWRAAAEEALTGMKQWRLEHPQATLEEIEHALDERLSKLRAQLLQDAAQASAAAEWTKAPTAERPVCPECQVPLISRGQEVRRLVTEGDRPLQLERSQGTCPRCGRAFFPSG
jgi:RNase P subunit RPR2